MIVKDQQVVAIHPSSVIEHKPEWCLYHELVLTSKNYIRTVTEVKGEWLLEIAPSYFNPSKIKHIETRKELESIERSLIEKKKKQEEQQQKNVKKSRFSDGQ